MKGRVQGVGYRWFAREAARSLSLTGYVKNLYNGDVEAFAEGEEEQLERFILDLKKGPAMSHVENVIVKEYAYGPKFSEFNVTF